MSEVANKRSRSEEVKVDDGDSDAALPLKPMSKFTEGNRVVIAGLKDAKHYNGLEGTVTSVDASKEGIVRVYICPDTMKDKTVILLEKNLRVLHPYPTAEQISGIFAKMEKHRDEAALCEKACALLWSLSANLDTKNLILPYIDTIVTTALRNHVNHSKICSNACGILWNLAVLNDENQASLRSHTSAIVAVMETHTGDMEAQKWSRRLLHLINKSDEVVKYIFNLNKKRFSNVSS